MAYPEGVAAAEILKAGSNTTTNTKHGSGLKEIMSGGIVSGIVALLSSGFQVISEGLSLWFHVGKGLTQFPIGYSSALVGATPWRQQVALILGCIVGALVIAPVLNLLYKAYGFPGALPRPDMDPNRCLGGTTGCSYDHHRSGHILQSFGVGIHFLGHGTGSSPRHRGSDIKTHYDQLLTVTTGGRHGHLSAAFRSDTVGYRGCNGVFLNKKLHKEDGEAGQQAGLRRGTLFASGLIVGESIIGVRWLA